MSETTLERAARIAAEAEKFEREGGEPVREVVPVRPGGEKATVLSVRLTRAQYRELEARAKAEGTKTSTLARDLLLAGLHAEEKEQAVEWAVARALGRYLEPAVDRAVDHSFGPAIALLSLLDPSHAELLRKHAQERRSDEWATRFEAWVSAVRHDAPVTHPTE